MNRAISNRVLHTIKLPEVKTLQDALFELRITYNQGVNADNAYEPFVFIRGSSWLEPNQTILDLLSKDRLLQKKAKWIYRNIILKIVEDYVTTTDVKMRVILSMLASSGMDKDLYITVCNNIIDNIKELSIALLDEELPF